MNTLSVKSSLLITLFIFTSQLLLAQNRIISGVIIDSSDNKPIPFSHVGITNEINGSLANENGEFQINVNDETKSISINSIGYLTKVVEISDKTEFLRIELDLWENQLTEAIVMPKSALEYVQQALLKHQSNITNLPFSTQAYFSSSNITELSPDRNIKKNEAVFRTYYPNYSDTTLTNESQLILHRFSDNGVEVDMSMIDNKKVKKKLNKLEKKQAKRDEKELSQTESTETDENEEEVESNPFASGIGPDYVLNTFQKLVSLPIFDEYNMEKIEFTLGKPSFVDDRELITIHFHNDKKIMLMFTYTGTLYLDSESMAIVSLDYHEDVNIPGLIRPIIKSKTGINITGFENDVKINNQIQNELWYPQNIVYNSKIKLKDKMAFKDDKLLYFSSSHVFNVESIEIENPYIVDESFLFDSTKSYEEQVNPINGLDWKLINVIN